MAATTDADAKPTKETHKDETIGPIEPLESESKLEQVNNDPVNDYFFQGSADSTNYNSVNKFNFVFYLIYKLKYDEEPTADDPVKFQF